MHLKLKCPVLDFKDVHNDVYRHIEPIDIKLL